jgi:hypothetical protein
MVKVGLSPVGLWDNVGPAVGSVGDGRPEAVKVVEEEAERDGELDVDEEGEEVVGLAPGKKLRKNAKTSRIILTGIY